MKICFLKSVWILNFISLKSYQFIAFSASAKHSRALNEFLKMKPSISRFLKIKLLTSSIFSSELHQLLKWCKFSNIFFDVIMKMAQNSIWIFTIWVSTCFRSANRKDFPVQHRFSNTGRKSVPWNLQAILEEKLSCKFPSVTEIVIRKFDMTTVS